MPLQSMRSNEVFTYWDSLRVGRAAPSRAQINPSALRNRLPDLFMLDWVGPQLKFRLAGTRICELFGRELRDTRFLSLWSQACRDQVNEAALSALRMEEAIVIEILLAGDCKGQTCEMLLLPLRSTSGVVDRLLGCLMPLAAGPILGTMPCGSMTLVHWTPVRPGLATDDEPAGAAHHWLFHRLIPRRLSDLARHTWRR
jgi:hypothetical protein